jgi:LmbE family N-acetylglucosaminyl deacetylase
MTPLCFNASSRLIVLAPHPDDETLATGVLLQKAVAAGASVRVVYATDGEDNPWPQRVAERRCRLRPADRRRWGQCRRAEVWNALSILTSNTAETTFLRWPDQQITRLLLQDCRKTVSRLGELLSRWAPTHLFVPATSDTHPDHSALALLARFAVEEFFGPAAPLEQWSFLVHGRRVQFAREARVLPQNDEEVAVKLRAIACHATQLRLSRRRFLAYAQRPELFVSQDEARRGQPHPLRCQIRRNEVLTLRLRLSFKGWQIEEPTLQLVGRDRLNRFVSCVLPLTSLSGRIPVLDGRRRRSVATAVRRGNAFHGELSIPVPHFAREHPIFVKLNRRAWFFDEAGWLEVGAEKIASVAIEAETRPDLTTVSG